MLSCFSSVVSAPSFAVCQVCSSLLQTCSNTCSERFASSNCCCLTVTDHAREAVCAGWRSRSQLRRASVPYPHRMCFAGQGCRLVSAKGLKLEGRHQVAESAEAPHRLQDWERRVAEGGRRKEVAGKCASARHRQEKLAWKKFQERLAAMQKYDPRAKRSEWFTRSCLPHRIVRSDGKCDCAVSALRRRPTGVEERRCVQMRRARRPDVDRLFRRSVVWKGIDARFRARTLSCGARPLRMG